MQAALMHCCRVDPEQDGTPTVMDTVEAVIEAGRAEGFHPERGEDTLRYSAPGVEVVDENLMVLADEHTLEIDRARLAAYLQDQASKGKGMVTPPPAPAAVAFGLGPAALGDGQLRQAELPAPPVMAPPMVEAPAPPPVMAPAPISVDTPPPLLSAAAAGVVATASAVSPGQATTPAPEAVRAAPTPTLPIPRRLSLPPDMAEIPPISVDGAAVRAFYMDRTLVTNQLYRDFLVATEYPPPQLWYGVRFPEGQGNHPVTGVSLEAARAFAKWRGRRLPTVSEWIAAATGGMRTNPWGDREIAGRCNCKQSGLDRTTPVGQFPQGDSPQGVSDLWGNVWEWVDSEIEEDRVLVLGGSFKHPCSEVDVPRTRISPEKEYTYLGFRCALSPDVP
jgi:formylglycine-generating enzyme required for sulfatase activity